jgi:hypothetical protein
MNWKIGLFSCAALVAIMSPLQAQLVTYQFTGTKVVGTDGIGETITGTVTLDLGAPADYVANYDDANYLGQYAQWGNGGFSIEATTSSGFSAGTSMPNSDTLFFTRDFLRDPTWGATEQFFLKSNTYDEVEMVERGAQLYSFNFGTADDGIANLPNPWKPMDATLSRITVYNYDYAAEVYEFGEYSIDSFTSNIFIDGCDTGVRDFTYQGSTVSQQIATFGATANNHGAFVSSVAKLTNALKKASLITASEKDAIQNCAANSSIGY